MTWRKTIRRLVTRRFGESDIFGGIQYMGPQTTNLPLAILLVTFIGVVKT